MKLSISQFMALQEYGYTIDEIREYEGTITAPQPGADGSADHARGGQPDPALTKPETEPQPEPKPEPQPEPQPENETQEMLRELLGIIRKGNINGLGNSTENVDPARLTASILAPNN